MIKFGLDGDSAVFGIDFGLAFSACITGVPLKSILVEVRSR